MHAMSKIHAQRAYFLACHASRASRWRWRTSRAMPSSSVAREPRRASRRRRRASDTVDARASARDMFSRPNLLINHDQGEGDSGCLIHVRSRWRTRRATRVRDARRRRTRETDESTACDRPGGIARVETTSAWVSCGDLYTRAWSVGDCLDLGIDLRVDFGR